MPNIFLAQSKLIDPTHIEGCKLWIDASNAGGVKSGNAAQFTAANSEYLSIANNAALSMGDIDFTVGVWVYLDSVGATRTIINKFAGGNTGEYWLFYDTSSTKWKFSVSSGTTTEFVLGTNAGTPSLSTWYFVVAEHDSVNNTIKIYVNNTTTDSAATTIQPAIQAGVNFAIGGRGSVPDTFWNGRIQSAFVTKEVLSAANRTNLYNNGVPLHYSEASGYFTQLQAYWNLGEESGQRNDSHGSNHLTDNATVTQNDGAALKDAVNNDNARRANDLSGNSNNAIGTGNVTTKPLFKTAQINGKPAISLDGSDDVLNAGSNAVLDDLGAMTVFAVINPTNYGEAGFGRIVDKSAGDGPVNGWQIGVDNTFVTAGMFFVVDYATTDLVARSQNHIQTGQAQIVAVTWDGSPTAANIHIYHNGTEVSYGTQTNAVGARQTDAAQNLHIGNEVATSRTFQGLIAEVTIHNRVMNAGELKREFRYLGRKYGIAVT